MLTLLGNTCQESFVVFLLSRALSLSFFALVLMPRTVWLNGSIVIFLRQPVLLCLLLLSHHTSWLRLFLLPLS